MSNVTDTNIEAKTLEEELESLALEENQLDDRASSLELKTILIAMLAGAALILSVAALTVALIRGGGNSSSASSIASSGTPANATTGGAGMAGMPMGGNGAANSALPVKAFKVTIKPDSKMGPDGKTHDAFGPVTDLSVKAGQAVRVTFYNYDDMPHSFTSPGLAQGVAIPAGEQQTQGTAQDIKVMPLPGVGVDKMIAAGSDKHPSKTILTFTAPAKAGMYIWYCKMPCDPWAMAHFGYMVGRVKVTAA
jgi:hypothetical protein